MSYQISTEQFLSGKMFDSKGKFYHAIKKKFARGWYDEHPFRIIDRTKIKGR